MKVALLAAAFLAAAGASHAEGPWVASPGDGATWARASARQAAPVAQPPLPPPVVVSPPKPLPKVVVETPPARPMPTPALPPPRVAPPELEPWPGNVPPAVTRETGVVGSPNLAVTKDYSPLDLFGAGLFGEDARTAVVGRPAVAQRSFVRAEFLLWWVRAGDIPVLTTTATGPGNGFVGEAGTRNLLGPGRFGDTARNGFRLRAGTLLGESGTAGLDAGFFHLGDNTSEFRTDSGQFATIARPFFAPNLNREFAELVAFPGLATGRLDVQLDSRLWGADVNTRCVLFDPCDPCCRRAELFAGYRHLNLRESLTITEFITAGPTAPDPVGTSVVVQDAFRVRNQFHGGQVGYAFARQYGSFEFDARLSVALGVTRQEVEIAGFQTRTRPGQAPEFFTSGLFAAETNSGRFSRDRFSVAPEATVNVGLRLTDRLKASVGYNFLAWSSVVRPGDQIDRTVDLSVVPNFPVTPSSANRPLPTFRESNLWAQGVQFGLEYRW